MLPAMLAMEQSSMLKAFLHWLEILLGDALILVFPRL